MKPFALSMSVKRMFFDRAKVERATERTHKKTLSQIGAHLRTRARTDILRRRNAVSAPGSPPSVHSRDKVATLRNILFAFEPPASLIVGPVGLNMVTQVGSDISAGAVPGLLEFGGTATIVERRGTGPFANQWFRLDRRSTIREEWEIRKRKAHYAPRPFMGPTLEKEAPSFASIWAGNLRAA